MLPAHLGPQALSLNIVIVWGDISTTILKDKEMSKNLRRMTDLLLRLSNIIKAIYPRFHEGKKLSQMQLMEAHVQGSSDLKDIDEWRTTRIPGYMEGRLVSATIKVVKLMCIKRRERFMKDLGVDKNDT